MGLGEILPRPGARLSALLRLAAEQRRAGLLSRLSQRSAARLRSCGGPSGGEFLLGAEDDAPFDVLCQGTETLKRKDLAFDEYVISIMGQHALCATSATTWC